MFGQLIDFGSAPFDFNDDNDLSFYVRLSNKGEDKVSWSIGYGEAIQESNINVGDWVLFDFIRKEAVQTKRGKKYKSIFSATKCAPPAYAKHNVAPLPKPSTSYLKHPKPPKAKGSKSYVEACSIVDRIAQQVAEKHGIDYTSPDAEPAPQSLPAQLQVEPPKEKRPATTPKKVKTPLLLKITNTIIVSFWLGLLFLIFNLA